VMVGATMRPLGTSDLGKSTGKWQNLWLSNDAYIDGNVGIGTTSPDGTLHVHTATAGTVTAYEWADDFIVEGSTHSGISILVPDNMESKLVFGTPATNYAGYIRYRGPTMASAVDRMIIGVNSIDAITIDNTGNVGIGTTSPGGELEVASAAEADLIVNSADGNNANVFFKDAGNLNGSIEVQPSQHFYLTSNSNNVGNIYLRTTVSGSAQSRLTILNNGNVGIGVSPSASYRLQVNGQPAANGYTAWTNYSDRRLKRNIKPVANGILAKILQVKPSNFNYNEKTGYDQETLDRRLTGFIAQELGEVFPEMVGETEINGETYLDTDLTNLQIYLVKAVQELKAEKDAEIEALRARVAELEANH